MSPRRTTILTALILAVALLTAGRCTPDAGIGDPSPPGPTPDPGPTPTQAVEPEDQAVEPEELGPSATWVAIIDATVYDGSGSGPLSEFHRSDDGVTWEQVFETPTTVNRVVTDGESFAALAGGHEGSTIFHSPDGADWAETSFDGWLHDIAYGNGLWVAFGGGFDDLHTYTSDDGIIWDGPHPLEHPELNNDYTRPHGLTFSDGNFLAMPANCGPSMCWPSPIVAGDDGRNWSDFEPDVNPGDGYRGMPRDAWSIWIEAQDDVVAITGSDHDGQPGADPWRLVTFTGDDWERVDVEPADLLLTRLSGTAGLWFGLGIEGPHDRDRLSLYVSTDLQEWTALGVLPGRVTSVAIAGEPELEPVLAAEPVEAEPVEAASEEADETEPAEAAGDCPSAAELEAAFDVDPTISAALVLGDGLVDIVCAGDWVRAMTDPDPTMFDPAQVWYRIEGGEPVVFTGGTSIHCDELGIGENDPAWELCAWL